MTADAAAWDRAALVAAYKTLLRHYIDQRPPGARQKIAQALGTHKSFISQITNPADPTPLPARHLEAIIDLCRLSPPQQGEFLDAYAAAHPEHWPARGGVRRRFKTLQLQIPVLDDPQQQRAFEEHVRDSVRRLAELVGRLDRSGS